MIAEQSDIKVFQQLQTTGKYVFASQLAQLDHQSRLKCTFARVNFFLSLTGA